MDSEKLKTVLVVVAHPDDEVLGCGGTIRKMADKGHSVHVCILCGAADASTAKAHEILGVKSSVAHDFPNIEFNVVPHLHLVKAIESAIKKYQPDTVITHFPGDLNVDHRVTYEACMAAVRYPQRLEPGSARVISKVLLMEVLSSTEWSGPLDRIFKANYYYGIEGALEAKLNALECFSTAMRQPPHPRSRECIAALACLRGGEAGLRLAESFYLTFQVQA